MLHRLTTLLFLIQNSWQLSLLKLPSLLRPCLFGRCYCYQYCDFLLGFLQLVYLHCSVWPIWPPSANAALAPHSRLQTSYPFSAHFVSFLSAPSLLPHALAVFLYLLLLPPVPDSLRVFQWNAGGLRAKSTELLHFSSSHSLTSFISRNLILIYLPLSGSLDSLLCNLIAPTPSLVFFLLMSQTLAAASSFSSGRTYLSLSFLRPLFLRLTPTPIM